MNNNRLPLVASPTEFVLVHARKRQDDRVGICLSLALLLGQPAETGHVNMRLETAQDEDVFIRLHGGCEFRDPCLLLEDGE